MWPTLLTELLPSLRKQIATSTGQRRFLFMRYRDTEYEVFQTANPTGWKWKVRLDDNRTRVGSGFSRGHSVGLAQRAIDKALPAEHAAKAESGTR
jgi:hypothetical protein